jgi:hypothetical protein
MKLGLQLSNERNRLKWYSEQGAEVNIEYKKKRMTVGLRILHNEELHNL